MTFRILTVCLLILYLSSAARTMTGFGDSDELITAGYTLSIPHPPGYPLLTGLLFFATHLPFVSPAVGAHGLAAVIMTLTMLELFFIASRFVKKTEIYLVGLLTFLVATTGLIWQHGTYIEPFGLSSLFSLLLLDISILIVKKFKMKYFILWSVVAALGMTNHQTFVLVFLVLGLLLVVNFLRQKPFSWVPLLSLPLLFGLVFGISYSGLYLLSLHQSPLSWKFDPSITGLWRFYTRNDFGGYIPSYGLVSAWWSGISVDKSIEALAFYFAELWRNWGVVALLGLVGFATAKQRLVKWFWPMVIVWFLIGPGLAGYLTLADAGLQTIDFELNRAILVRMYLLGDVWWGLFSVLGGLWVLTHIKSRFVFPIVIVVVGLATLYRFPAYNLSRYTTAQTYATQLLNDLPWESRLLCLSDLSCFGTSYLQSVLGIRTDVVVVSAAAQFHYRLIESQNDLWAFRYPDNPFRLGELIGWSVWNKRPIFVSELSQYWARELGLDGQGFWLSPAHFSLQIQRTRPLYLVTPEHKSLDFNKRLLTTHRYIAVLRAVESQHQALSMHRYPEIATHPCTGQKNIACALWGSRFATWREPTNPEVRLTFAKVFEEANLLPFARREYQNTLILDPKNTTAEQGLARLGNVPDLGELY